MPRKSKRSQAASRREAEKAKALSGDPSNELGGDQYQYQYRPSDPELQPYWDAFYENPYPSEKECEDIADKLGRKCATIKQWFRIARQYTHAPEREPGSDMEETQDCGVEDRSGNESDISNGKEYDNVRGTLYEHFYSQVVVGNHGMKRGRSDTVTDNNVSGHAQGSDTKKIKTKAHQHSTRGPYTKDSRTTAWRNRKHVKKCASDIRSFFPSTQGKAEATSPPIPEVSVVESDSELHSELGAKVSDERAGVCGVGGLYEVASELDLATEQVLEVMDKPDKAGAVATKVAECPISMEEYQKALNLLEASMHELKLDLKTSSADIPEDWATDLLGSNPGDGPTLEDAEIEIQESTAQLDNDDEEGGDSFYSILNRHLQRLLDEEKKSKTPNVKNLIELTTLSDYSNLRESYRNAGHRAPSTQASNKIAEAKFVPTAEKPTYQHESWYARRLRAKANHLVRFGCLPVTKRGQGATHYSLLAREDVKRNILLYLRTLKVGTITPVRLRREVNQNILPELGIKSPISEKTSRRWIEKLGYRPVEHRKGLYMDGHERSDVVEHRQQFLETIKGLLPLTQQYDDKTDEPLPLILPPGQKHHVPIAHDECCFHANDRETFSYLREGEQQLRQKGRGRVVHVSDFVTEEHGRLALPPDMIAANQNLPINERLVVTDARKIIEPGKNHDKWWDMDQLCEQLVDAIKIFERLHPDCVGVFFFDQSSAHGAFADDALVVKRMNVGIGGKSAKPMHTTTIPMDNPHPELRGKLQPMVFEQGHPNAGQPKGMRVVLEERRLLETLDCGRNKQPVGVCSVCRTSDEARAKAEKEARERMEEDPEFYRSFEDAGLDADLPQHQARSATCCMQRCLSLQQDFLDEKPRIQLILEQAGHLCVFLPKFHCELNPIEMYWGYAKRLFRERADGTITTARKLVPESLDACSTQTIRHFWRKSWRYMDAYMTGLTGKDAEQAVKKYKSHRRVTKKVVPDVSSDPN